MEARNAQNNETVLFSIISIDKLSDSEKKTISCINEILHYINVYHRKKLEFINQAVNNFRDSDYKDNATIQSLLIKAMRYQTDVDQRKQFVTMLRNKQQQERLLAALDKHCEQKNVSAGIAQIKKTNLQNLFDEFVTYGRFAYLTADDLSVVARTIDILLRAMEIAMNTDPTIKSLISQKREELMQARNEIKACMNKHIEIYDANKKRAIEREQPHTNLNDSITDNSVLNRSLVEIPQDETSKLEGSLLDNPLVKSIQNVTRDDVVALNNDILLPLREEINALFGKDILNAKAEVWVDASLELPLPVIEVETSNQDGTVLAYFKNYINADIAQESAFNATGFIALIRSLSQTVTSLITNAIESIKTIANNAEQAVGSVKDTFSYYFNPVSYWTEQYETKVEEVQVAEGKQEEVEEIKEVKQEEKEVASTKVIEVFYSQPLSSVIDLSFLNQKNQILDAWCDVITTTLKELEAEIGKLTQSCFSFFYDSKIADKEAKYWALQQLQYASCKSFDELQEVARGYLDNRQVRAGMFSRTDEIITFIVQNRNPDELWYAKTPSEILGKKRRAPDDLTVDSFRNVYSRMW